MLSSQLLVFEQEDILNTRLYGVAKILGGTGIRLILYPVGDI